MNDPTIKLRAVQSTAFSRDGHTQTQLDAGEVAHVPERTARSMIRGGKAVPADSDAPDDLPEFGGQEQREAEEILRKHDLSVHAVPGDETVQEMNERHEQLTARLEDAREALHEAEADLDALRSAEREGKIAALTGEADADAPPEGAVSDAEERVSDLQEQVDVLRDALQRTGDRLAEALESAHDRADSDAQSAHESLLRKCLDAGRKFRARLDDLVAFEAAYAERIEGRVGDLSGVESWLDDAQKHA